MVTTLFDTSPLQALSTQRMNPLESLLLVIIGLLPSTICGTLGMLSLVTNMLVHTKANHLIDFPYAYLKMLASKSIAL